MAQSAVSPSKEEKIVVGIQRNNIVSGQKWDRVKWENLSINPLGNVSQIFWWVADVAYEQISGHALVVWNDNPNLKYSIWDGSNWSASATIMGPLSGEAKQIRLASKPGSDEIIAVVASTGGDYALVWDGNSWGNGIELDGPGVNANYPGNNTDYRDVSVAYEHQSGRAVVAFGIKTGLSQDYVMHYKIWDVTTWLSSSFFQPSPTINITSRAKYITLENDSNSNRIVAGIKSAGANGWVSIWDGSTWDTPELLTRGSLVLDNSESQNLTVGFESKSGQALEVYGRGGQNVFYQRNWTVGIGWSSEQIDLNLGNNTNTMEVYPSLVSDTIMLAIQDDGSDINYVAWDGNSWGSMTQMTFYSRETQNKPFTFLWKNATKIDTTSFPSNSALTTDATELSFFLGAGEVDCYNNFGFLPHLPPIAVRDTVYVDKGATISFNAIENDSDPEGTVLDLTLLNNPSSGTAGTLGSGYVEYGATNAFQGTVQFDYQVCDQGIPTLCDTTTITVIVISKGNDNPIAQNDYDSTVVNSDIVTSVLANDFDPEDGDKAVTVGGGLLLPTNGSVFVQNGKK
jgi:hypothetical protein